MSIATLLMWAVLALILLVLLTAATRPDSFRLERSTHIKAAPVQVQAVVADFHRWTEWSPWEHIDPTMQRSYSGSARGVGAVYAWTGTGKADAGRMEIKHADASRVLIQLDFIKPFTAHNTAEFTFAADATGTQVSWAMYGPSPFISKLMGLVFSMDKLVGKDFEKGLAAMQELVEADHAP